MAEESRHFLRNRRFGLKTLTVVAFMFFLGGFVMSPGINHIAASTAETPAPAVQASAEQAPPTSPFTALAAKLTPSVVNVKVTKVEKAGLAGRDIPDGPFGDFFKHFFDDQQGMPNRPVQGAGSGVIINANGTILTNNHVVEGAREVTVTLNDKRELPAQIVGRDPKTDLAVLKIDAGKNLPAASMGDSDQLKVGDWVMAIGNPFGLSHTVTSGIVSAKGRVIGAGPYDDFIQTDASINPGNSGGPLFNMKGEIVGINTAIIPNAQGIGFAIPIDTAKPLIPQLVSTGEVSRGYLGVNIQSVTPDLATALNLSSSKGALVAEVVTGGPADKAGIKRGDVIVAFGGKEVADSHDLPVLVAASPLGKDVAVTLLRNGKEQQVTAKITKLEQQEPVAGEQRQPAQGKWGLQLQDLTPEVAKQLGVKSDHGVVVVGVQPGSPADRASIQQGDVILEVNHQPVKSAEEVKNQAESANSLLVLIKSSQGTHYAVLKG